MKKIKKRICIIKFDGMGDVLRTTPILRRFEGEDVFWITEETSFSLLRDNPFIKTVIPIFEMSDVRNFMFDELYNFDEDKRACSLAAHIRAEKKKGYGFKSGGYFPFDSDSEYAYELSKNDELKFKLNKKTYQQIIFEMAGFEWKGEDYVLGYKPRGGIKYSVGINYLVGKKFPNKAWPHWKKLSDMLDSVSLQEQFGTIEEYIDWINSCRFVVTGDSLGMHIALALKKKVIVLMGSTSWNEIETYGRAVILKTHLPCSPCYKKNKCNLTPFCMDLISPESVYSELMKMEDIECRGARR
ncbi:MAG: glycosyltransferase family 9 protein [Candidatus Omnitrophica bacterium]|nr:glycosyltransferase family 9 protein [Candidatus Omnitrophota bacterium]